MIRANYVCKKSLLRISSQKTLKTIIPFFLSELLNIVIKKDPFPSGRMIKKPSPFLKPTPAHLQKSFSGNHFFFALFFFIHKGRRVRKVLRKILLSTLLSRLTKFFVQKEEKSKSIHLSYKSFQQKSIKKKNVKNFFGNIFRSKFIYSEDGCSV